MFNLLEPIEEIAVHCVSERDIHNKYILERKISDFIELKVEKLVFIHQKLADIVDKVVL